MPSKVRLEFLENLQKETCFLYQSIQSKYFPSITAKFRLSSLSGKSKNQILFSLCRARGHPEIVYASLRLTVAMLNLIHYSLKSTSKHTYRHV